jgi:hypothetical protein
MRRVIGCITSAAYHKLQIESLRVTEATPKAVLLTPGGDIAVDVSQWSNATPEELEFQTGSDRYVVRSAESMRTLVKSTPAGMSLPLRLLHRLPADPPWRNSGHLPDMFVGAAASYPPSIPYTLDDKTIFLQIYMDEYKKTHQAFWFYPAQVLLIPFLAIEIALSPLYLLTGPILFYGGMH